jgi:transposase-like protein
MDDLSTVLPSPKRRQTYTSEFKAKVLKAYDELSTSVAAIASQFSLNANLIHNWRKKQDAEKANPEFLRLPNPEPSTQHRKTVKFELPGGVVVYWPLDKVTESIPLL